MPLLQVWAKKMRPWLLPAATWEGGNTRAASSFPISLGLTLTGDIKEESNAVG